MGQVVIRVEAPVTKGRRGDGIQVAANPLVHPRPSHSLSLVASVKRPCCRGAARSSRECTREVFCPPPVEPLPSIPSLRCAARHASGSPRVSSGSVDCSALFCGLVGQVSILRYSAHSRCCSARCWMWRLVRSDSEPALNQSPSLTLRLAQRS